MYKKIIALILLVILLLPVSGFTGKTNGENQIKWEELFEEGRRLSNEKKYQEAISNLVGSLSFDPENPRSYALLGTIFFRLKQPEKARFHWERGIIRNPDDLALRELLTMVSPIPVPPSEDIVKWKKHHDEGEILLMEGKFDEAIKNFKAALKFYPENKYSLFSIGVAYYKQDNIEQAKTEWGELGKNESENIMLRDIFRVIVKNPSERIKEIEQNFVKEPENENDLVRLANIYMSMQKYDSAEEYFSKAFRINRTNDETVIGLATVAFAKEEYEKSASILSEALKTDPEDKILAGELYTVEAFLKIFNELKGRKDTLNTDEMVLIPVGGFIFGNYDPDENLDERPVQEVYLPDFYIDKYEVTNKAYYRYVSERGAPPPGNWGSGKYPPIIEDLPVFNVNWYEADAYCRFAGKRLPTEQEWEKAARGTEGLRFPWGDEFRIENANTRWSDFRFPLHVAAYPDGQSPYGVFNMSGNLWEWTSDWYKPYPGNDMERKEFGELYRVQRGGGYLVDPYMHARTTARDAQLPIYKHRTTGIRCVKSAENK